MMKTIAILLTMALAMAASACHPNDGVTGRDTASGNGAAAGVPGGEEPVLLFTIGMHIEPLGATAQKAAASLSGGASSVSARADYNDPEAFARATADIEAVTAIVEAHGGRMTIQTQSPYTTAVAANQSGVLSDLEEAGHEIGLHFHEEAHLGKNGNSLGLDKWCSVMKEEIGFIHAAGVEGEVSYWSGGNLYPNVLEAAACAGLSVNSDWKNPNTQETALELVGTNPWRPAGGTNGEDLGAFSTDDPTGPIIFLPEGDYDRSDFAASRRSETAGGDEAYFAFLADQLHRTLESAVAGKVNVFHFTVHPGEFRGSKADQFGVIERFLTTVVDPLVAEGRVQWATFGEMGAAFDEWARANPGVDARGAAAVPATASKAAAPTGAAPSVTPRAGTKQDKPSKSLPGATAGKVERDVTYCTGGGTALRMDIYYPAANSGAAPAVLFVHGGGWSGGDKASGSGSETIPALVDQGFLVAAANYRLAPENEWPAQIEDVKCAVRYLRANASDLGIDPDAIGAMGGSAGGHLVAMLGVTDGDEGFEGSGGYPGVSSRVQAVVDMFGPADLTVEFAGANQRIISGVFGVSSRPSEVLERASPVTGASADDPAFLILQGRKDSLVPPSQSQALYDALTGTGGDADLVMVENAGHGFKAEGGTISPSRAQIGAMIVNFFATKLK